MHQEQPADESVLSEESAKVDMASCSSMVSDRTELVLDVTRKLEHIFPSNLESYRVAKTALRKIGLKSSKVINKLSERDNHAAQTFATDATRLS